MIAQPQADFRYEIKYAANETNAHGIRAWVGSHPSGFRLAYPARRVNSLYLDTTNRDDLHVNLAGLADRGKLRLRWYGDTTEPEWSVLESKQKRGNVGCKVTAKCDGPITLHAARHNDIVRAIRKFPIGNLAFSLQSHCNPVLYNHYHRDYYVSADGLIRLTIDTALHFFDQTCHAVFNDRYREPSVGAMVIELKASEKLRERLAQIAGCYPFRATSFSKFSVGQLGMSYVL
jgi:SPX domain protein involved in polyphosphate accumulation